MHLIDLRNMSVCLPSSTWLTILQPLSDIIMTRNPAGRYWGNTRHLVPSTTSTISTSINNNTLLDISILQEDRFNELQFAHRVIFEKLHQHDYLMKVVIEMVI
jgi:hypothetical protein